MNSDGSSVERVDSVLDTGAWISERFARDDDDITTRWMAHRIAELMKRSQFGKLASREDASRECSELIQRLWKRRQRWPKHWPPEGAARAVEALRSDLRPWEIYSHHRVEDPSTWIGSLSKRDSILEEERTLWRCAALLEMGEDDLALPALAVLSTADDAKILRELGATAVIARSTIDSMMRKNDAKTSDEARLAWIRARIVAIHREAQQLLPGAVKPTPHE